ncbi:MAG: hypothetical protein ACK548_11975 [Planctomycetota bacterium]
MVVFDVDRAESGDGSSLAGSFIVTLPSLQAIDAATENGLLPDAAALRALWQQAIAEQPELVARRKFKHRSRTTRDPPARSCTLRATPSTRPQPPARTDPRPHAAAFPPRAHTAAPPRPLSGRNFAPHRHSAGSPSSAASLSTAGGARHPAGSAPAAVRPSAASTRAIAAGSWIAASTRREPAHFVQTSTSMPNTRRSRSAHGKRCR